MHLLINGFFSGAPHHLDNQHHVVRHVPNSIRKVAVLALLSRAGKASGPLQQEVQQMEEKRHRV